MNFEEKIKVYTINQFKSTLNDLVIEDNKNLNNINIYNDNLILLRKLIENSNITHINTAIRKRK